MSYKVKYPSLYFNWLPLSVRKGHTTPELYIISDDPGILGVCRKYYFMNGPNRDCELENIIEIYEFADCLPHVIAHEYGHSLQGLKYFQIDRKYRSILGWDTDDYDWYVNYFSYLYTEIDAELFACKYASDESSMEWVNVFKDKGRGHWKNFDGNLITKRIFI